MTVIENAERRLQEEIRQNDLGSDNGHLLAFLYGRAHEPVRKRGMRVELDEDMQEWVSALAEKENTTKTKMTNAILRFVNMNKDLWP